MVEIFDDSGLLDGLDENQKQLLDQLNQKQEQEKEKLLKSLKTKQVTSIEERQNTMIAFNSFLKESLTSKDKKLKKVDIMVINKKMTTFCKDINAKVIQLSPSELTISIQQYNDYIDDKIEAEHKQEKKEFTKSISGQEDYKKFVRAAKSLLRTSSYYMIDNNVQVFGRFCQQLKQSLLFDENSDWNMGKDHRVTMLYSSEGGSGKSTICNAIKESLSNLATYDRLPSFTSDGFNSKSPALYPLIIDDEVTSSIKRSLNDLFNYIVDNDLFEYRVKYQESQSLRSITNLLLCSNTLPSVTNDRRFQYVYMYEDHTQNQLKSLALEKSKLLLTKEETKKAFMDCLKYVPLDHNFGSADKSKIKSNIIDDIFMEHFLDDNRTFTVTQLRSAIEDYGKNLNIDRENFFRWFCQNEKYFDILRDRRNELSNKNSTTFTIKKGLQEQIESKSEYRPQLTLAENIEKILSTMDPAPIDPTPEHKEPKAEKAEQATPAEVLPIPESNYFCSGAIEGADDSPEHFHNMKQALPLTMQESLNPLSNPDAYCSNDNVSSMRNMLFECDDLSLDEQKEIVNSNKNIINRAVFSGNKSIHARITLSKEPESLEHYKFIWGILNDRIFKGQADKNCSNPGHMTRVPNAMRYTKMRFVGVQELLFSNSSQLNIDKLADKWNDEKKRLANISKIKDTLDSMRADVPHNKVPYDKLKNDNAKAILDIETSDLPRGQRIEILKSGIPSLLKCGYSKEDIEDCLKHLTGDDRVKDSMELLNWIIKESK